MSNKNQTSKNKETVNNMLKLPKSKKKQFQIAAEGQHSVVLGAVQDCGTQTYKNEQVAKLRFVWIVGDEFETGTDKPILLIQYMSFKLTKPPFASSLYKTLRGATGKPPDPDLDFDTLVGLQALVTVYQKADEDGILKANIDPDLVSPPAPGQCVEIPEGWEPPHLESLRGSVQDGPTTRMGQSRPAAKAQISTQNNNDPEITDADIPF